MKLNNWSVVRSPKGVSAKPLAMHNDIEVCVSITDGKLNIGVYRDGYDAAIKRINVPIKKRQRRNRYIYKPAPEAVESINMWAAQRAFNQGNDLMSWLYLFGIEFYKEELNHA